MKQIQKIRLRLSFFFTLFGTLLAPTLIDLQGEFFTSTQLSLIFIFPIFIRIFQTFLSKLSLKISLYLPAYADFLWLPISIIVLFYNLKIYIITEIIIGAFFATTYYHRSLKISEIIKDKNGNNDIVEFFNSQSTYAAFGGLTGLIISYFFTKLTSPITLIISTNIAAFLLLPYILKINKLVILHINK